MFKKTIFVSGLNLSSFVVQFLLNLFIAAQFGLGKELDFYNKAISIPSYFVVLLTSCVSFIFIPIYSKLNKGTSEISKLILNEYFNIVGLSALILVIFVDLFSFDLVSIFNSNYSSKELYSIQIAFIIYSPFILFAAIIEFLNSILYTNGRFKIPLFLKILNPIIVMIILLIVEKSAINIAFAFVISALVQLVSLFLVCNNSYFNFSININIKQVLLRNKVLLKLSSPLIFSIVITKTLPIFDIYFLSRYSNGVVSNVILSQKLITTLSFIINSFFSVLFFSQIANRAAENNFNKLFKMLLMGIKTILFLSIPVALFLNHNSETIFKFLFVHGKFSNNDAVLLANSFNLFVVGLPVIAIGSIISYAIYSIQYLRIFYITSIIEIITYVSVAYIFKSNFGYNSIPIAYIINFAFSNLILFILLKLRLNNNLSLSHIGNDFIKLFLISFVFIPYFFVPIKYNFITDCFLFLICFSFFLRLLFTYRFIPIIYLYKKVNKYVR